MKVIRKRTSAAHLLVALHLVSISLLGYSCFACAGGRAGAHSSNIDTEKYEVGIDNDIICSEEPERIISEELICPMQKNLKKEEKLGKTMTTKKIRTMFWGVSLKDWLVSRYFKLLETYTLATKCVTSGGICLLGDFFAQTFENRSRKAHQNVVFDFDKLRAFALVFESIFLSGPLMHYAFDYMEYLVPITKSSSSSNNNKRLTAFQYLLSSKWGASFLHVASDIIVLGPIYVLSMMITSAVIEGHWKSLWLELKIDFLPTMWASTLSSCSFLPIQMVAFRMLPVQLRLLYMNMQDIVWNAVVSYYAHRSRVKL